MSRGVWLSFALCQTGSVVTFALPPSPSPPLLPSSPSLLEDKAPLTTIASSAASSLAFSLARAVLLGEAALLGELRELPELPLGGMLTVRPPPPLPSATAVDDDEDDDEEEEEEEREEEEEASWASVLTSGASICMAELFASWGGCFFRRGTRSAYGFSAWPFFAAE